MQCSWNHGRAYYRCKFPKEYAQTRGDHPSTLYVREDALTEPIDNWLARLFDDDHIDSTCAALEAAAGPEPAEHARLEAARQKIKDCDDKLAKYREALEAGTDPDIVGAWIQEVTLTRKAAEIELRPRTNERRLTDTEVKDLVTQLKDIVAILQGARPDDRKAVYRELSLEITYSSGGTMQVTAGPSACTADRVGGGDLNKPPHHASSVVLR